MPALLIECLQKRPKGQNVHFTRDGTAYSFEDRGDGRQIAVIEDRQHQATFLGIPMGFVFAGPAPDGMAPSIVSGMKPTGPEAAALEKADRLKAELLRPAPTPMDDADDAPVSAEEQALALLKSRPDLLAQLLAQASPAAPVTLPEPPKALEAAPALPDQAALEAMTLADLRMQFKAETGKNPSPKNNEAVLIAKILAEREVRGA